ncbi:MAG: ornithine cyclodeaminase family protein [Acidobacteria bacterium]|nr:ornithine cyclodeaminase family protein [Acidobacteriota bacterium]
MVLVLSEFDVASVLGMSDGVRLIEDVFRQHAAGETILVPRLSMNIPGSGGAFRAMAAVLPRAGVFGVKTLTGYPGRRAHGETYFALLLFDASDGALRAVIAANHITGIRTGASTGVAARYLARDDASVIGIFGGGVQARHQVAALAEVRRITLVKVFDVDAGKALDFAGWIERELNVAARPGASARETVAGSDLVVTATTSSAPVFSGEWLEEGTHVSGVGSNTPAKRELDGETFRRSKVVVDFKDQVLEEAGDLRAAIEGGAFAADAVHAQLGEIVAGRKQGRQTAAEITLFKSVGVAIEDVATAAFVYTRAMASALGTPVALADATVAAIEPVGVRSAAGA